MGLVSGLLLLPLAPVRATVWLAEVLAEQARNELESEPAIRRQLLEAELQYELGKLSATEFEAIEDALLDRLEALRDAEHAL